jgi:hypothetical protein
MSLDKRNHYEIKRDNYSDISKVVKECYIFENIGIVHLVLSYLQPYALYADPYERERQSVYHLSRQMYASHKYRSIWEKIPSMVINKITQFLLPFCIMSEPIPCAITTMGRIHNFNYNQQELYDNAIAEGDIESIHNKAGIILAEGKTENVLSVGKNKHGRPSKKQKCKLFGTSQTTFKVKTKYRKNKIFAIKVFQGDVNLETLGGVFVDCRDTRDTNNTILYELQRSLNRPDIIINEFRATMRNYRFRILGKRNICIAKVNKIIAKMHNTTHPKISCSVNINKYPSAIIEIQVDNHASKKKKIIIKVFQSGKINLDSNIYYEHVYDWYRFINEFFIQYSKEVLYLPHTAEDDYDSDYYYEKAGVLPPPKAFTDYGY